MRQVKRDELIWAIRFNMRGVTTSLRKQLISPEPEKRRQAEDVLAAIIADKALSRYEIMIDAPEGPPAPNSQGIAGYLD